MDYLRKFLYNNVYSKTIKGYFIEEPEKTNYEMFMSECGKFLRHCHYIYKNMDLYNASKKEIALIFLNLFLIAAIVITCMRIRAVVINHRNRPKIRPDARQKQEMVEMINRAMQLVLAQRLSKLTEEEIERARANMKKYIHRDKRKPSTRDSATKVSGEKEDIFDKLSKKNTKENSKTSEKKQDNECAAERVIKKIEFIGKPSPWAIEKRLKEKLKLKNRPTQFNTRDQTMKHSFDGSLLKASVGKDNVKVENTSGSGDAIMHSETVRYSETSTTTEISDYDDNAIKSVEIYVPPQSKQLKSILKKRTPSSIDDVDRLSEPSTSELLSEPSTPIQTSLESKIDANGNKGTLAKKNRFGYVAKKPVVRRNVKFADESKSNGNGLRIPHKGQMITKTKIARPKKTKDSSSECESAKKRTFCFHFNSVRANSQMLSDF